MSIYNIFYKFLFAECPSNCLQCDSDNTKCDAGYCAAGYGLSGGQCSGEFFIVLFEWQVYWCEVCKFVDKWDLHGFKMSVLKMIVDDSVISVHININITVAMTLGVCLTI